MQRDINQDELEGHVLIYLFRESKDLDEKYLNKIFIWGICVTKKDLLY